MIWITQLVFVREDEHEAFLDFESHAIPLMAKYGGKMVHRVRAAPEAFLDAEGPTPYEIHVITFPSEEHLARFMADESRKERVHLKERSVTAQVLVKGTTL